ncbi:hypothetical protein CQA53_02990 [Helicobacter didelphidarum]|uniref:Uncharacterized protein n=1 Tax=Helicobacter didelphidarum TaxID=2040648 RepID=A0A3D8IP31_9HELI|nr:hypothetical protein CQA53_02990 [Helicobacter didelphidarum]
MTSAIAISFKIAFLVLKIDSQVLINLKLLDSNQKRLKKILVFYNKVIFLLEIMQNVKILIEILSRKKHNKILSAST